MIKIWNSLCLTNKHWLARVNHGQIVKSAKNKPKGQNNWKKREKKEKKKKLNKRRGIYH